MGFNLFPSSDQVSTYRTRLSRGGLVAYDALDFSVSAANTVVSTNPYLKGGLGQAYSGSVALQKFNKLKIDAGMPTNTLAETVFARAADVATVGGMVVSAIALPQLITSTETSFKQLSADIHNAATSDNTRLNDLGATAMAAGGSIYAGQGLVLGVKGTLGIMQRNNGVARVVSNVNSGWFGRLGPLFGRVFRVLLPIADGAVFLADGISLRSTFMDPTTTTLQRFMSVLNFGLASLKVAFWLLPGIAQLRAAYMMANAVQLGLTLYNMRTVMGPAFQKFFSNIVWGVTNPGLALQSLGKGIANGVGVIASAVVGTAGYIGSALIHPIQSIQNTVTELGTWWNALVGKTRTQVTTFVGTTFNGTAQTAAVPAVQPFRAAGLPALPALPALAPYALPAAPVAPPMPSLRAAGGMPVAPPAMPAMPSLPPVPAPPSNFAPQAAYVPQAPAAPQPFALPGGGLFGTR